MPPAAAAAEPPLSLQHRGPQAAERGGGAATGSGDGGAEPAAGRALRAGRGAPPEEGSWRRGRGPGGWRAGGGMEGRGAGSRRGEVGEEVRLEQRSSSGVCGREGEREEGKGRKGGKGQRER